MPQSNLPKVIYPLTRILVCGDRNWTNINRIREILTHYKHHTALSTIIEGEARGADTMARIVAIELSLEIVAFPAYWTKYGRGAGPIRNKQMLDEGHPQLILAFHNDILNSKGTLNMIKQAQVAHIPFYIVTDTRMSMTFN
jgi:hypothetical protein